MLHRLLHWLQHGDAPNDLKWTPLVNQMYRLAFRIGENRIVAGLHYPVDLKWGAVLGVAIADHIARMAGHNKSVREKSPPPSAWFYSDPNYLTALAAFESVASGPDWPSKNVSTIIAECWTAARRDSLLVRGDQPWEDMRTIVDEHLTRIRGSDL